jgi:hypothetical protein
VDVVRVFQQPQQQTKRGGVSHFVCVSQITAEAAGKKSPFSLELNPSLNFGQHKVAASSDGQESINTKSSFPRL